MKNALVIVFNKAEEIEAISPIDILRRADVNVTVASLENTLKVVGRSGIEFSADELFKNVSDKKFDVAILSGGPGIHDILNSQSDKLEVLRDFLTKHIDDGKIAAAICAAPLVFDKIGLLKNKKCTAHHSAELNLSNCVSEKSTLRDGNVITSRGAGTAIEFSLEIVSALLGENVADNIAKSICFNH